MNFKSIKSQLSVFLILFALYISFIGKDELFLLSLGISLIAAIVTDSVITYLKKKKIIITEGSVASGLIIGYVMASSQVWWMIVLGAVLAISSKHIIKSKARHIFNPAGFGVVATVFLLGASTEWKGAYLWYIIIPIGIYFIYKIRKLEIVASYFIASFILFGIQSMIQNTPVLNTLGYLNYFFIFIMLIEPMTTPVAKWGKIVFGLGAGVMIFVLYLFGVKEAELLGLLSLNILTPLLNRRREK
jgi:Na+-translocating ferredoxin:NAD+ oxidoreductase subunit D